MYYKLNENTLIDISIVEILYFLLSEPPVPEAKFVEVGWDRGQKVTDV